MKKIFPIMLLLFALTVIVCHSQEAGAATISVKNFGVAGDGTSDDGPAIRKAVEAAIKGGPGTKLVFESKTYRLGANKGGNGQIRLVDVDGLTIDGNDSTLLLHPQNGMFDVLKSRNVVIRGFTIDFDPLPFTQGTISRVDAGKGYFDLEFHKGYLLGKKRSQNLGISMTTRISSVRTVNAGVKHAQFDSCCLSGFGCDFRMSRAVENCRCRVQQLGCVGRSNECLYTGAVSF